MQEKAIALVWNVLTVAERRDVILKTNLPTALQSARWNQLTQSEQDALFAVDWHKAIGRE